MKVMPLYNFNQIVKQLKESDITPENLVDILVNNNMEYVEENKNSYPKEYEQILKLKQLGIVKEVHSEGGGEGEGEYVEHVFHFKNHNVFVKITGRYESYNGTDYHDGYYEVFPKLVKRVEFHLPEQEVKDEDIKEYLNN